MKKDYFVITLSAVITLAVIVLLYCTFVYFIPMLNKEDIELVPSDFKIQSTEYETFLNDMVIVKFEFPEPEIVEEEPVDLTTINIFTPEFDALTIQEKLIVLQNVFTHGAYWNTRGLDTTNMSEQDILTYVSDTPCYHSANGYGACQVYNGLAKDFFSFSLNRQCLAFASLISDLLLGKDTPIWEHSDYNQIKIGDHIRLEWSEHSVAVIGLTENGIIVAEVNADYETCMISWGREISRATIENQSFRVLAR